MSSSSSIQHNPLSVSSMDTPATDHDDVSVTASDDIDARSTTATDPSEQGQSMADEKTSYPPRNVSPSVSRGPVQLLRRQLTTSSTSSQPSSRQATPTSGDIQQPSPTRVENIIQTPVKDSIDPSLLEAFANPMNRQYLLQLEGSLNNFVTQTRLDTLELPPTNSFFRCLAHKMADHYKLQHVADSGHVVLFRSPYARIPESRLSELSKTIRTTGSASSSIVGAEDSIPQTSTPEFKQIMKRVPKSSKDGEDDAKSESSQSQVLSHEERQAVYEKTRARIFSDYVESQGVEPVEKESDAGSETSSMRREKSLHRSDSFQTRQQFAREGYSSYAAALTGQQQQQQQQQASPPPGIYTGFPIQGHSYPNYPAPYPPAGYPYPAMSQTSSRDPPSSHPSRPESRTSSPATNRNDSPGFQPNPFAREFVPTGASGGGSGVSRPQNPPKTSLTPPISGPTPPSAPASRNSAPPTTQQVKKKASFENGAPRPATPAPVFARSQSASSMRPAPPPQYPQQQQLYPPVYVAQHVGGPLQMLPLPPPTLLTPRQAEWGPPITTGTIRYMANGQQITPQVLPYRAHPVPAALMKPVYAYPPPQPRNGVIHEGDNAKQGRGNDAVHIGTSEDSVTEKVSQLQIGEVENHNDHVSTEQNK